MFPGAKASASDTAAAASSIDSSAAKAETVRASNPAPAGEAAEGYLPPHLLSYTRSIRT